MPKRPQILTVGHSTHPIEEFIELLQSAEVTSVVDVRSLPGSTKYPQFNQENLMPVLENAGISYVRIEKLGGLRKKTPEISDDVNAFWENKVFAVTPTMHSLRTFERASPSSKSLSAAESYRP